MDSAGATHICPLVVLMVNDFNDVILKKKFNDELNSLEALFLRSSAAQFWSLVIAGPDNRPCLATLRCKGRMRRRRERENKRLYLGLPPQVQKVRKKGGGDNHPTERVLKQELSYRTA